jgi:uncharacterized membrane protein
MTDKIVSSISIISIIVLVFLIQILTPKLTRKEIYFGVRISKNEMKNEKYEKIYKQYVMNNIIVSIPYIIIVFLLSYYFSDSLKKLNALLIIAYLILSFFVYSIANKKVKKIKSENKSNLKKPKKSVVVIDTDFTKEKSKNMLASPWWFLIPLFIIAINVYIGCKVYSRLPELVPTHWNAAGVVDAWTRRSYKVVFQMPAVQLFMTAIMFFSYKIIGWSKQQINASKPKESKERNKIFRYRWSLYMIIMCIVMTVFFTFGNLSMLQVINMSSKSTMIFIFTITLLMIFSSVFMAAKTGQGGSRINIENKDVENLKVQDRDDDKYWKLANSIYVNKDDPAIFVEKRFGIGWTMNFGRTKSLIIVIVFIILVIAVPMLTH